MTGLSTRDHIIEVARKLFTDRGYSSTTIRDIASAANVSPALVIKLTGSKAELFCAAAPEVSEIAGLLDRSEESIGYWLARAIVERRDVEDYDYWAAVPFLLQEAPDRAEARADLREAALKRLSPRIGDNSPDQVKTQLVVTLLLGLATSIRTVGLLPAAALTSDELIERYGALLQSVIDGA